MRIIHTGDIHLGSGGGKLPMGLAKTRRREITDAFVRMFDYAKENNVKTVIIAGDLFDKANPPNSLKREALQIMGGFNGTVIYVKGNHDAKIEFDKTEFAIPKNLKIVCNTKWSYTTKENVTIASIDAQQQNGEGFYEGLDLDEKHFNIVVLHGSAIIPMQRLRGKNIDYLALGDIHIPDTKFRKLDNRGVFGYAGCLEGRGFDEPGERGFFVLDIEHNTMKRTFIPQAKRLYRVVEVDITGLETHSAVEMKVRMALQQIDKSDIVRVKLFGKYTAESHRDVDALAEKLREEYFWAEVIDESRLDRTNLTPPSDEISLVSRFMRMVGEAELDETQKDKVIEYALKALTGEEIAI